MYYNVNYRGLRLKGTKALGVRLHNIMCKIHTLSAITCVVDASTLRVTESMRKNKTTCDDEVQVKSGTTRTRFFALFQVAFSLSIGFLASLEGSVIEMNPTASAAEDSTVS